MNIKIAVMTAPLLILTYNTLALPLYAAYHGTWPPCAVMTAEADAVVVPKGRAVTGVICRSGPFAPDRFQQLETAIEAAQSTAEEALTAAQDARNRAEPASTAATEAAAKANRAQKTADEASNTAAECCARATRLFEQMMRK
jgi:hypothetical protein